MKYLIYITVAVLAGFLGWRIYQKVTEPPATTPTRGAARSVAVTVEPVRKKTIINEAEFTGSLDPVSRFIVAPKVTGRLEQLLVNIGDPVNAGDLVAVLDDREYTIRVEQAKAELEVSRANLAEADNNQQVALREENRLRELHRVRVSSESELDTAEALYRAAQAKYEVAKAQVAQKQAALRAAEVQLSYTRIHVNWQGENSPRYVAERFVDEGALLSVNIPIVSIVDLDPILAVIHVIERDFPNIQVGQAATLTTDAYRDRRFEGRIIRRAPVVREESRQARVEIEVPNPEGLLAPGMFARIHIRFDEQADATVVPRTALAKRNGNQGVFVADLKEKKAHFIPVKLGIVDSTDAQVLEPPLEGRVVTLGQHLLEDGAAISIPGGSGEKEGPRP
jgi:RND family efflux transporter MFP subunit